jgi:hypothetical protein
MSPDASDALWTAVGWALALAAFAVVGVITERPTSRKVWAILVVWAVVSVVLMWTKPWDMREPPPMDPTEKARVDHAKAIIAEFDRQVTKLRAQVKAQICVDPVVKREMPDYCTD